MVMTRNRSKTRNAVDTEYRTKPILDTRAAHTPRPVGDRLRANASKLRAYADTHDRTRITLHKDAG